MTGPTKIFVLVQAAPTSPIHEQGWPEGFLPKQTFKIKEHKRAGLVLLRTTPNPLVVTGNDKPYDNKRKQIDEMMQAGVWGQVLGVLGGWVERSGT